MRQPDIHASASARAASRGAALIITLAILVLITFLVVALFTTVTNERMESSAAANRGDVDQLAAATVDLVKATITQATAGYESDDATGALNTANRTAWASQPGLIRTWKQDGNPYKSFRLYSGGNLETSTIAVDGSLDVAADAPSAGWKTGGTSYNALWSDLNAPAPSGTNLNYPIVTPPKDNNSGSVAWDVDNGVPTDRISTTNQEGVQGFAITNAPGFSAGASPGPTNNPAPMPVKWLYVLKDGTFVAPTGTGAVANVDGASPDNPIVGRIAYWTDDETCKVNINTASEGSYWDVPKSAGRQEEAMGANGPVNNEWQRIPGHPATTSLSAVFEAFGDRTPEDFQEILSLTPRTAWGGSENGTKPMGLPVVLASLPPLPSAISLPTRRLYATADELFYSPQMDGSLRRTNSSQIAEDDVARRSFFLTAFSRAPDVNMFDQPRISLWPITWINTGDWGTSRTGSSFPSLPSNGDPSDTAITTSMPPSMLPSERLIAFASSLGKGNNDTPHRYFFTRQLAMHPTHDFDNIRRNRELFDYLRDITSRDIPGFGESFMGKWGSRERNQILTSCFDYIRSAVNLNTSIFQLGAPDNMAAKSYFFTPRNVRRSGIGDDAGSFLGNARLGGGQVLPINIQRDGFVAQGSGRTPIITEAALVFYAIEREDPVTGVVDNTFEIDPSKLMGINGSQTKKLGCFLLLEMYNPVVGMPHNKMSNYAVRVRGQPFRVEGNSLGFPSPAGEINLVSGEIDARSGRRDSSRNPTTGFHTPLVGTADHGGKDDTRYREQKIKGKGAFSDKHYPFYGEAEVSPAATTFTFSGSQMTIELLAPNSGNRAGGDPSASPVFQTYTLDFSQLDGSYPMPRAPRFNAPAAGMTQRGETIIPDTVPPDEIVRPAGPMWFYQYTDKVDHDPENPFGNVTSKVSDRIGGIAIKRSHTDLNFRLWFNAIGDAIVAGNVSPATCLITPYDTIISVSLDGYGPALGDPRLVATARDVPSSWYRPIDSRLEWFPVSAHHVDANGNMTTSDIGGTAPTPTVWRHLMSGGGSGGSASSTTLATPSGRTYYQNFMPENFSLLRIDRDTETFDGGGAAVSGRFRSLNGSTLPGTMDWTAGDGSFCDGAFIDKAIEVFHPVTREGSNLYVPFFTRYEYQSEDARFSPNMQIASAVQFGSLPTGTVRVQPWQTLLFSPNPAAGSNHSGLSSPPDHLLLDLFSMPIVEPYPISEPLSTAGRININQQIAPFTHIDRKTGIYALLKSLKMPILTKIQSANYKFLPEMNQNGWAADPTGPEWRIGMSVSGGNYITTPGAVSLPEPRVPFPALAAGSRTRYSINIDETLKGFDQRFAGGDTFRSASEICEMFLVPRTDDIDPAGTTAIAGIPTTLSGVTNGWWTSSNANHSPTITGDNQRESPYNQLYPRVTTKSNTFTVYYRVQVLKQTGTGGWDKWDEAKDVVLAESRGSETIERYVDPNDPNIPDFANPDNYSKNLAPYYRWRTLSAKQFVP